MNILHFSHGRLPDPRIEKVAHHFKQKGHHLSFLGLRDSLDYVGPFDKVYSIPIHINSFNLIFGIRMKSIVKTFVKDTINPDLLHIHDSLGGSILTNLDIPGVFDDHEFMSRQLALEPAKTSSGFPKVLLTPAYWILHSLLRRYISSKEFALIAKYPTIVTNTRVQKNHSRISPDVSVVYNFPALWQVANIDFNKFQRGTGIAYVGYDGKMAVSPHRDSAGITDYVEFDCIHGRSHEDLLQELTKYRFGVVGWKPHPILDYKNQNKCYEYLHSGCQIIIPQQLRWQFPDDLPFIHTFQEYTEIPDLINNAPDIDPTTIVQFARENFLWEQQSSNYDNSYKKALQ